MVYFQSVLDLKCPQTCQQTFQNICGILKYWKDKLKVSDGLLWNFLDGSNEAWLFDQAYHTWDEVVLNNMDSANSIDVFYSSHSL